MIKNIIFDVGEVLLEYRWKDMLMAYGLDYEEAVKVGETIFNDPLWVSYDLAIMSIEEIISEYGKKYPEYAEVIEWFIMHGENMQVARKDVWDRVLLLKEQGYRTYILSNYPEELFIKHTKNTSFINIMDGMVVSYQIHIAKPDRRIYEYLLDKYYLKAEECLFFDDRKANTDGAKSIGINAITITSKEQLLNVLDELLKK